MDVGNGEINNFYKQMILIQVKLSFQMHSKNES